MSKELDEKLYIILCNCMSIEYRESKAIAEIKAAILAEFPTKIKVSEFNEHMKDHIFGYNQAIKDIIEKL